MFQLHQTYERPELLQFVGSKQRQSGIIWNKEGSDTIIVTTGGRHTKRASYSDSQHEGGIWEYTAQGEKGDQNPNSYANSLLQQPGKKILLFSTREPNAVEVRERGHHRKMYRFEGIFRFQRLYIETQTEGKRKGDKLVKFVLEPIDEREKKEYPIYDPLVDTLQEPSSFYELRKKVSVSKPSKKKPVLQTQYWNRSVQIKKYALLRAEGKCENCDSDAPFVTSHDIPFLEVHHIFSLSDEGPDHPVNVAAICPNCHKEAHYGKNQEVLKEDLSSKIADKEDKIDKKL